ncbi:MAG: hypothetical protein N4A71_11005 [Carboxylicivirga sp.]|jgi:hypothetical protein|nr:hypothetical protein [Carboxylicivirga sp.]
MDTITVSQAQANIDNDLGYVYVKAIINDNKETLYPESILDAMAAKKQYNSPYTIWYSTNNELKQVVYDDDKEITTASIPIGLLPLEEKAIHINDAAKLIKLMQTDEAIQHIKSKLTGRPITEEIDVELIVCCKTN